MATIINGIVNAYLDKKDKRPSQIDYFLMKEKTVSVLSMSTKFSAKVLDAIKNPNNHTK